MSSPALRGSAEWSASREVALLLGLTRGNLHAAQQLWLRKERIKAEASQVASAGAPQASQQPAGCQAKPAPARAQAVPKPETAAQLARRERSQIRLRQKRLASKMWATIRIASRLLACWLGRARTRRVDHIASGCGLACSTSGSSNSPAGSATATRSLLPAYVLYPGCISWWASCYSSSGPPRGLDAHAPLRCRHRRRSRR